MDNVFEVPDNILNEVISSERFGDLEKYFRGGLLAELYRFEIGQQKREGKKVHIKIESMDFWDKAAEFSPQLAKMAKDILSVPASSISCEQLFSKAGRICSVQRAKMDKETLRKQLSVYCWSRFFDKINFNVCAFASSIGTD